MPGQGVLNSTLKVRKIATHSSYSLQTLQMGPKGLHAISQPLTWSQQTGEFFSGRANNLHFKCSVLQIRSP